MPSPIRSLLLAAMIVVLAGRGAALSRTVTECLGSRYLVDGGALVVGDTAPHEPVTIAEGLVSIGDACAPTPARYRFLPTGVVVRATWKHCTGLRGRVTFQVTIPPGCAAVSGRLRARRSRVKRLFSARLSTCGDGIADLGGGEECDGGGCPAGTTCTGACACESTEPSVARKWDEAMLAAIRVDTPRPTVHARNLFHVSVAMWDAWAAYDQAGVAAQYLTHEPVHASGTPEADRAEAVSFAAYRVLKLRYSSVYANAAGSVTSEAAFDALMDALGYDKTFTSTDGDSPGAVGNRIGAAIVAYGGADGANEPTYGDPSYVPVNDPLVVKLPGTVMADPNRWQPLALDFTVTQNGIPIPDKVQSYIGARWDGVRPWALVRETAGHPYHDPGPPPLLGGVGDQQYKQSFLDNIRKSSLLDPGDGVVIDISPAGKGNNHLGTNDGAGYAVNPVTGQPYAPNSVKRGDWARVLAEFWADGPNSETPPGHWNVVANYTTDHLNGLRRIGGTGRILPKLEWDVKLYLALNGAVHDAAIGCWGTKRHYDGVRPISAIRYMGGHGQSSDAAQPSYDPMGLPLVPGLVEVITAATTAPGQRHEALRGSEGQIAVRSWPGQPSNPSTGISGVRWIRAVDWVPYQKSTFVTPAFPGYTSGHSTFSRASAEVLTSFTGSPYFPGGLGEFEAPQNSFLKFELGPSERVVLQWATYYDAADEAGISRLFGGIHPAQDDFGGRVMGARIGKDSFARALQHFAGSIAH